jgi:diguanylate cyclase (GGDEF)-like protein
MPERSGAAKPHLSIVGKLTLLVLAVGLPLSGILAWSLQHLFRSEREAAEQYAVSITGGIANRAEMVVDQTRSMLQAVAKRPGVQALDRSRCDPFLNELRQSLPQYANLNTFNLNWEFVCSSGTNLQSTVIRSDYSELYERMRKVDDMALSAPVRGQLTGRMVVIAAYPVKDSGNNLLGAITAPINLLLLASGTGGAPFPTGTLVRLVDRDGHIVISYPDIERIGSRAEGVAAKAVVLKSGTSIESGLDGIERVYAYHPVKGTNWTSFAGVPTSEAFAEYRRNRNQILVAVLLVLVFAASLAIILAYRIARPLRQLRMDAAALANGQLGHRSRVETRDEFGQLAAAFNDMAQAIETNDIERAKTYERIRRLNRVYAVLSGINALIVRVHDRDELFSEACRIGVEDGQFRLSWIGLVDRVNANVVPVAWAGAAMDLNDDGDEDVRHRQSLLDRINAKSGPTARAVREKRAVVVNDTETDHSVPSRSTHATRGVRSFVILPLIVIDEVVAIFSLQAAEVAYFDEGELKLLTELSDNIAHAIDYIAKQDRLEYLADYDVLTGLANRRLFLEQLTQQMHSAASDGRKLTLFLIDLERFKNINDSLGRQAGDDLLMQVAHWMTRTNQSNSVLGRVGADQFARLLTTVQDEAGALQFLQKTRQAFEEHPFQLSGAEFRITVKVGVALFPNDGADAETLFRNAEAALKKAKARGEKYLFYKREMTEAAADKLTLENRLRQALENEEFVLHYQPKVNLETRKISGAEALIRWHDPREGLVAPGRFIPILEETGLIHDVGRWAVRKAIEDYLRWLAAGRPAVRIAVNVSPLQLRNQGFITEIKEAIGIDARAPAGLELEITESLIMEDVKSNITSLQAIRAMGVIIAIDDFGTGFSSLSYLAKLPVHTLKIDRSFVVEMTMGPEGLALVSTIINLAHSLKLKVVAEGVETEEQSRLLRLLGCDEMQGYLFCRPIPADVFEEKFLSLAET